MAGGLAVVAILGVILAVWVTARSGRPAGKAREAAAGAHRPVKDHHRDAAMHRLPSAEAGLLRWRLAAPISREVVATWGHQLIVLGGLTASGASAAGVYAIRTATHGARYLGALKAPVHDAAMAVIGRRALVFGGGTAASVAAVQAFSLGGRSGRSLAVDVGSMPMRRSDGSAVTIGSTVYVVGGYDGARPDAAVLATANGRAFKEVAALRVPVRYPGVAALGGQIYVFGGQAVTGPHAGAPVDVIQSIDPARHTASVIGHLPEPLMGAIAVTLDNELFVAGGDRPDSGTSSSHTATVSTIWVFNPAAKRLLPAGRLKVPVSHAGVAVIGSTAWIVGGESDGALTTAIQMLRPN